MLIVPEVSSYFNCEVKHTVWRDRCSCERTAAKGSLEKLRHERLLTAAAVQM